MGRRTGRVAALMLAVLLAMAGLVPTAAAQQTDACTPVAPDYRSRPDLRPLGACANLAAGATAPGLLLASPRGGGRGGPTIYANDGSVVWNAPDLVADTHNLQAVTIDGKPRLVYYRGGWMSYGIETRGEFVILDEHYRQIGTIAMADGYVPSLHELRITARGTALMGAYTPSIELVHGVPAVVTDYVVQEIDFQHGGRVLFQWKASDHVPYAQTRVPDPAPLAVYDWFHGNSIDELPGGDLLVSSRNTWSVYRISRADGHIVWTLGSPATADATFGPDLLGSDRGWFCYQHDARAQPDGTITLFDNGGGGVGCEHPARALTIGLDEATRTATVVGSLTHRPEITTQFGGNAESLPTGGHLVSWADTRRVTEYAADDTPIFDLSFGDVGYRTYRAPWIGIPLTPPDAIVDGGQVFTSWNGATQVASWQLLGGPSPDALAPIGAPVPRQGFETAMSVPPGTAAVGVQALEASGAPLPNGRAVAGTAAPAPALGTTLSGFLGALVLYGSLGLPLVAAVLVGLGLGLVVGLVRLARRGGPAASAAAVAGVALAVVAIDVFAVLSQSFFPPLLWVNLLYPLLLVLGNLVRWPVVGIIAGLVAGRGAAWRREPQRVAAYTAASWVWVALFAVRAAVHLALWASASWAGLAIAKAALGWPLWLLGAVVTGVLLHRARRAAPADPAPEKTVTAPATPELRRDGQSLRR